MLFAERMDEMENKQEGMLINYYLLSSHFTHLKQLLLSTTVHDKNGSP